MECISVSFTLNFVRNRQFILRQFYRIQHCLIIKNFDLTTSTKELKERVFPSTKNKNALNGYIRNQNEMRMVKIKGTGKGKGITMGRRSKPSPNCLQSPTENGKISDLKRQHNKGMNMNIMIISS